MAESLRRIVDMDSFALLQEKLENWLDDYDLNSCDQNVDRCVEVIELNSRIQSQLFRILHISAAEGSTYGGIAAIKSRLLPWLGHGILSPSPYIGSVDATLKALTEAAAKDRELVDLKDVYERSIDDLEADLHSIKDEAHQLKLELTEKDIELESVKRNSTSDKMFADNELQQLRNRLNLMEGELVVLRSRSHMVDSYEREIRRLRDELIRLTVAIPKSAIINGDADGLKSLPSSLQSTTRPRSPTALGLISDCFGSAESDALDVDQGPSSDDSPHGIVQKYRQQRLVARFDDMFIRDRLNALDVLRQYSDDQETNKKILFRAMQESFIVARLAFINFKMRIRSTLASVHSGPGTLEQSVQDYVNRNPDLYNLSEMVNDVVRNLDRRGDLPDGVSSIVLQSFIREACRLAWSLSALPRPLETLPASEYELYDASKYRRSFDSDVSAALVLFHVWPCLVQGKRVVAKGEAYTAKAGTLSPRRSRSPTRSPSPTTFGSYRASSRSRSPSPSRRLTDGSSPRRDSSPIRSSLK